MMFSIKSVLQLVTFFLLVCFSDLLIAQSINQFNNKGKRTGKWIIYLDDSNNVKSFEGKFRNGISVGTCYYYTNEGVLEKKDVKKFRKLKTTFYHPNGKVRLKGNARLENLPDRIHYYFYGQWKVFDETGVLIKSNYYTKGELTRTVYFDKNIKTNDSLINALTLIDKEFTLHNNSLVDSANNNRKNKTKYLEFRNQLHLKDSLTFNEIEKIFRIYGYPSVSIVGEASAIPFYILGFAPISIKEKNLEILKIAADNKEISWRSLAMFIDKIKVAKNEKQIYRTQSWYDKKTSKEVFYPTEDLEHLNERRLKVGLDIMILNDN